MKRPMPTVAASLQLVELFSKEGWPVLLPASFLRWAEDNGVECLTVQLQPPDGQVWLSIPEAAKLHIEDVDGLQLKNAAEKIRFACNTGKIRSKGRGHTRRLDPTSFAAWRLRERERHLDRLDHDSTQ